MGEIHYPYLFNLFDELNYAGWVGCAYRPLGKTVEGLGWAEPLRHRRAGCRQPILTGKGVTFPCRLSPVTVRMSLQPKMRHSIDEYLTLEASTHEKHEYFQGEVFAMGGASEAHNLIVLNIGAELRNQLKGRPCRVYPSDLRVKVSDTGLYTYPDVIVACGKPQIEQPGDALINPTLIVEVLSDSSEAYDRGKKFEQYRTLASLTDYLLVAQDKALVEHYSRQPEGRWLLFVANHTQQTVPIASLRCELSLAEVYLNVDLDVLPAA